MNVIHRIHFMLMDCPSLIVGINNMSKGWEETGLFNLYFQVILSLREVRAETEEEILEKHCLLDLYLKVCCLPTALRDDTVHSGLGPRTSINQPRKCFTDIPTGHSFGDKALN